MLLYFLFVFFFDSRPSSDDLLVLNAFAICFVGFINDYKSVAFLCTAKHMYRPYCVLSVHVYCILYLSSSVNLLMVVSFYFSLLQQQLLSSDNSEHASAPSSPTVSTIKSAHLGHIFWSMTIQTLLCYLCTTLSLVSIFVMNIQLL